MQAALTTTSTLADFTTAKLILPELQERSTVGVINELNYLLQMNEGLPAHLFATSATINHELLTSMRLDGGMVIAQVRLTTLPHTRFALGRAKEPLPWRASRLAPITFVALVVEPSSKPVEYKGIVEALNTLAHHTEALKLMRESSSAAEMLSILGGVSFHRT
jgi:mannitol/fructose-specific phosphotransferase system IIA component (Ntr-type)